MKALFIFLCVMTAVMAVLYWLLCVAVRHQPNMFSRQSLKVGRTRYGFATLVLLVADASLYFGGL